MNDSDYIQQALLSTLEGQTHFEINQQAATALDLGDDGKTESETSRLNSTVYSVLNKCRTASGQRLLRLWLRNPLTNPQDINRRLDIVEHLSENNELRTTCCDYLKRLPDLLRVAFKIHQEKCTIVDLVKIYQLSNSGNSLHKTYKHLISISGSEPPASVGKLFDWIKSACANLVDFVLLLEESLILDKPDENNDYLLKPKFNDDIAKITEELDSLCRKARQELRSVGNEANLEPEKGVKLEIDAEKGFVLRVTKQNEQSIRDNSRFVQTSTVKKDGFRFTTKYMTKLSNAYVEAKAEYNSVAKSVYEDIISKAVMFDEQVLELCMAFTVMDVFVSLAVACVQNNYVRPLILDSEAGKIEIERLRHPCLENQPDVENYVPNDISLNRFDKNFQIVTGPNMGGKSTYIKSIAIAVIMAQCGSLIPAEDGKISIVDNVFTRVGAGDRQSEGISTFMEEMMDMSVILKSATKDSLIVIDELGRGTSTFDGFGLAWAISKHLATETKCYCVFATHFHELTEMEKEVPTVGNLHVKAYCHENKLTMLYNVGKGVCDESYGIHVARYVKFPDHVVSDAEEKLKQFEEVPGFEGKTQVRDFVRQCVKDLNI